VFEPADIAGVARCLQPYRDFWASYFQEASETTKRALATASAGAVDSRAWQRRWLEAVSRSVNAWLRSPFFLRAMKQNMDALIKTKEQADNFHKEIARTFNLPTASDLVGLFERLRGVEDAILARLTAIEHRMDTMESKMRSE